MNAMSNAKPNRPIVSLRGIFSTRTPRSILYLLLSFPLGLFNFIFLVVGLSTGFALVIVWIGVPILLGVLGGIWALTLVERNLAEALLDERLPPMAPPLEGSRTTWQRFKAHLANRVTWSSAFYLFLRFPLGIGCFVLTVTLLALSLGLLAAPLTYTHSPMNLGFWEIDTPTEAWIASGIGLVLLPPFLMILNAVASLCGLFARTMLGAPEFERASEEPPIEVEAEPATT